MGDTTIRLSDDAKERLRLVKREGESYEDVIVRLTARDKWAGFGALADGDRETRSGLAKVREKLSEDMDEDIEEMGR
jgi:predicted CopG family antitoxin